MIPKRIRLLQSCFKFKYEEVSKTLATDKELRDLQHLKSKIEKGYVKMVELKEAVHG